MKKIKALLERIQKRERGAIVVEATIALTTFVFAMFIILSIVDICYVQAKMGIALNSAAKEMSQYAYMYEAFNISDHMTGKGGKSSELMGTFSNFLGKLSSSTENFSSKLSGVFNDASQQAAGDSAAEYINNGLGMGLATLLVQKNLKSYEGQSADAFLRSCNVKNGLSGLNFLSTTFLTDENQNKVKLIVHYEVEVLRLLDTRYTFKFIQKAETKAWTKGVSSKSGSAPAPSASSIWDTGTITRGNSIITSEKKAYKYTSTGNDFHAYDSKKNQFVKIRSLDTFADSYNDEKKIEYALNQTYNTMKGSVEDLETNVPMQNSSGKDTTVKSDPNTRTYKVVLVVPDSSDMEKVNAAVTSFKNNHPGVDVEVKTGYGDPTSATKASNTDQQNTKAA